MNNRRSFFKQALATLVAPLLPLQAAPKLVKRWTPTTGIIYAPYIMMYKTVPLTEITVKLPHLNKINEELYTSATISTNGELV